MSGLERTMAAARRGAAWLLPADRRDWVAAVWAEAHEVPPGLERLAWRVGGIWMLARGALMPRRLVRVALFAVTAAVTAWTAWPDSSVLHAAADQFGLIATVLLLAGLPLLARRFFGPVSDGRIARFLRVAGYAAILALMPPGPSSDRTLSLCRARARTSASAPRRSPCRRRGTRPRSFMIVASSGHIGRGAKSETLASLARLTIETAICGRPGRPGEHLVVAYDLAVDSPLMVRPARVQDVKQMARVHVRCWQETYRGLMPDAVLDDPGFPAARERMWIDVLTSERYRRNRVAVAERDGELVGIAMSGPPEDVTAAWTRQLYVLYVSAADHGTGAGEALLEAVIDSVEPAALWVADPNPRAQAFYRKHGFVADGTARSEDGVREIRMVRSVQHGGVRDGR